MATTESDAEFSSDCFVGATYDVGEAGKRVRWMLRLAPAPGTGEYGMGEMQNSGWLFMTGNETGEQANEVNIYYLKAILKNNPEITPYLATPAPCRLERDGDLPVFLEVLDD